MSSVGVQDDKEFVEKFRAESDDENLPAKRREPIGKNPIISRKPLFEKHLPTPNIAPGKDRPEDQVCAENEKETNPLSTSNSAQKKKRKKQSSLDRSIVK